jgi:hypothetical protein
LQRVPVGGRNVVLCFQPASADDIALRFIQQSARFRLSGYSTA